MELSPEVQQMMDLNRLMLANPEQKYGLMQQWNDLARRQAQKKIDLMPQVRDLTVADQRRKAQALVDQGGPGYGRTFGESVLGNNNLFSGSGLGEFYLPEGNAYETILGQGADPNSALAQYAYDQDFLSRMNQGQVFNDANWGHIGYNTMGIGANNTASFGYGGDGENYFRQELYQRGLQAQDANRQAARDWEVLNNKNPNGVFGNYGPGSARNGRDGIQQFGDPRQDTGIGGNLAWQPPFLRPKNPMGEGLGLGGAQEPVRVPTNQDTIAENKRTIQEYQDRLGITPVEGGGAGYRQERNSDPYWQSTARTMSLQAFPAAMGVADSPVDVRRFNANSFSQNSLDPPRQFGRTLSPDWLNNDIGQSQLFGYGQAPQRNTASSAFDRYATDPITAGMVNAEMRGFAKPLSPRPTVPFGRLGGF